MGGTTSSSRNDQGKSQAKTSAKHLSESVEDATASSSGEQQRTRNQNQATAATSTTKTKAAEESESAAGAAAAQRLRQTSTWSLGSLSGRLNWSFTGASRNSFRNRNKATRKSFTSLQQRRSKTLWHKPLTNAIFSTHFKESSRNEQFHIEHLVAKGAFGVVFQVIDKRTVSNDDHSAVSYALKVLKKSKIIEENSVQQIKDEADIQKLCGHHPFIVQQVDLWQNRRNLHILSEYVPNGELFSKIAQFSIDLIRVYLAEIALAIDFLHNAGIIYRDAKPENILLTENFHIKLTDFGLSKWLKLGVTTKTMCGTFQYMAPEILRGEAYGHSVDWWSLGIIACQMFTGMSPDIKQFLSAALPSIHTNGDSVDNAVAAVVNGEDENFLHLTHIESELESQNLPQEAKDVLKRLLTVDPRQRLRSVMALQRIALYKNFKIDSKHLLSISLQDIISKDNIVIYKDNHYVESSSVLAAKAFQGF